MNTSENLSAALAKLNTAIDALVTPKTASHTDDSGKTRTVTRPSVYVEMTENLAAARGTTFGGVSRSLPPVHIDALDWVTKVDNTVRKWWPEAKAGTIERLDRMSQADWRPQDAEYLEGVAGMIQSWVTSAESLLGGRKSSFGLDAACPSCSERWIIKTDFLGEHVRVPVLTITDLGCSCQACGFHWGLEYFIHLAALIDQSAVEAMAVD